ncbi:MAG: LapA family protein [Neisseriaceae bacterium]|nr:LapA family protein [Neisseriaceae bacterium]
MKYFYLIIKLVLLLFLLMLTINNTHSVAFNWFMQQTVQWPLVVLLLIFFVIGAVLGVLSMLGRILRLRNEVNRLRKENHKHIKVFEEDPSVAATVAQKMNQKTVEAKQKSAPVVVDAAAQKEQ